MFSNHCRSCLLVASVVFLLSLITQVVAADDEVQALVIRDTEVEMVLHYRAGEDVPVRNLGEFLQDAFSLDIGGRGGDPIEGTFAIETVSREFGTVGKYESRVELSRGTRRPGATLVRSSEDWIPGRLKWLRDTDASVVLGRFVTSGGADGMPRECEDDTHAVRFTLTAVGERTNFDSPLICISPITTR